MITRNHAHIDQALKTPQFYLIWLVLFLNVTAGIGVLGQASVMIQESFKASVTAGATAGFVGLLSLFNMGGHFVWASGVGLDRTQEHLLRLLRALVLRDPVHVRRRLCDRPGLSRRYVRHEIRGWHSWTPADRVGYPPVPQVRCW